MLTSGALALLHGSSRGAEVLVLVVANLVATLVRFALYRGWVFGDRGRSGGHRVTGLVFSFMQGIIHPYYMVALAPAIGALVGVGASSLWQARLGLAGRVTAAVAVLVTAIWSFVLLNRTPDWLPWLRWLVLLAGALAVVALFAVPVVMRVLAGGRGGLGGRGRGQAGRLAAGAAFAPLALALVAGLAGPLAYSLDTVNSTHTGSLPSAGPQVAGAFGGLGGGFGRTPGSAGGGFP